MIVLFTAWGYDVTVVELASVILAFIAIALGIAGSRWTWPFYFLSSMLYGWLFLVVHLFASAALQLIFMAAAAWGWFSWGREGVRVPGRLTTTTRIRGAVVSVALWVALAPVLAGLGAFVAGMAFKPTRFLLDKVLPKPGDGPSEKTRQKGHFTIDIYTTTSTDEHYVSRVKAKGDPGYAATAMMLGESALALALDRDALPSLGGGVLTPASGIGDALVDRLRGAGMEITARKV